MRGKPIITSAITTEIITKVLEKCNVNVEILGFTTKEWKGGESKKKWENLGKPSLPGRLNDLLHIIYKGADCRWSNCKKNLGSAKIEYFFRIYFYRHYLLEHDSAHIFWYYEMVNGTYLQGWGFEVHACACTRAPVSCALIPLASHQVPALPSPASRRLSSRALAVRSWLWLSSH